MISASAPLDTRPEAAGSRSAALEDLPGTGDVPPDSLADLPGTDADLPEAGGRQHRQRLAVSFEIMPPRSAAQQERVPELFALLEACSPDYVAVTSSVGTGWSAGTAAFISQLAASTRLRPLAHLSCTAAPRTELIGWIDRFIDAGVRGFLAVRGDLPAGAVRTPHGHLRHADALVSLLRRVEEGHRARLCAGRLAIGVAAYPGGHPESSGPEQDIDVLAAKQRNGADFAITQLFFDPAAYRSLTRQAVLAGITLPIIPGIVPLTSRARLQRMCALSGLKPPPEVLRALAAASSPEAEYVIGLDITAALVEDLVAAGAPGLHFCTFNSTTAVRDLLDRLTPTTRTRLTHPGKDLP